MKYGVKSKLSEVVYIMFRRFFLLLIVDTHSVGTLYRDKEVRKQKFIKKTEL